MLYCRFVTGWRVVQSIALKAVADSGVAGAPSNKQDNFSWKFHDILHNAGQDTVYDTLCAEVVSTAVAGTNATIMAYGQVRHFCVFPYIDAVRTRNGLPRLEPAKRSP